MVNNPTYVYLFMKSLLAFYCKLCIVCKHMVVDINLKILADDIKRDTDSIMQKPTACALCKTENVITRS